MRKVPKLRFKEFNDEWEERNILELCSMKARIGWQNLRKEEHLNEGNFYLVTGTDFELERINWANAKYVEKERYLQDKNIILKEGDILITKDGSIGKLAFVENIEDRKATLNNGIFRIRLENQNQNSKYLFYTFLSNRFKIFLQQLTAGSTIVHLYQKDFEKYKIAYPFYVEEQEKIANFLSSVDKKISLTEEKLNLFKEYKKGIMQKIFSQELRFKDSNGNNYPNWEEKKLGDISINIGYGLNASAINFDGKNKYIRITDIDENGNYKPTPLTSPSGNLNDNFLVEENDILFARTGASVGKTYHYNSNDGKLYFAGFLIRFNIKNENSKFVFYNTLKSEYKKWVILTSTRTGQPGINAEEYKNFRINLPCLEEQKKIADFLSSIDNKIEKIENEVENLKEFKKGLLQQMFI